MSLVHSYKPIHFFAFTLLCTWIPWFAAAFLSHQRGKEKFQIVLMFVGLAAPFLVALTMLYASKNQELIRDFWHRLFFYKFETSSLLLVLMAIPAAFFLATALSLLFGKSAEQFTFAKEFNVMKGWNILSLIIPIVLAPLIEELGWRGYGVDSLRSHFNLFNTSLLFAALWGAWHLPLFFIKGYYNYELRNLNIVYLINYFVSLIPVAILMNWAYYKNSRSILVAIVLHALLNGLSILFKTEQFTKCLFTLLLYGASAALVIGDKSYFFESPAVYLVKQKLNHLRDQIIISENSLASISLDKQFQITLDRLYHEAGFPGAVAAYILPNGKIGMAATGLADIEAMEPMTTRSRMLAASIGKTFVAAAVLALANEGLLSLDQPISTWFKERPWFSRLPNNQFITLRHLLTHSSGLPDHVHMDAFSKWFSEQGSDPGHRFDPEELVQFVLDQPALFEAGKGWAYSDTGYFLIGLIIESVSQEKYYEQISKRFLIPLHLTLTSPSDNPILPSLAAGYASADFLPELGSKTTVAPGILAWNPAIEWTGGGLISHPHDLVVWAKALYEGNAMEGDYFKDLFHTVSTGKEDYNIHYGAGVLVYKDSPLGPVYGHFGKIPGYVSSMRYYPKYRMAVAFQINTDAKFSRDSLGEIESRLAKVVFKSTQVSLANNVRKHYNYDKR